MADWFRRSTWTPSDRDDFEARLRRARALSRAQYLRIQAVHLMDAGRDDLVVPALELLERAIATDPNGLEVALAEHLRAGCYERTGDVLLAVEAYRKSIAAQGSRPSLQTDAVLDFAILIAERNLATLASEAANLLDSHPADQRLFPVQRFKYHAARALLNHDRGGVTAAEDARRALDEANASHSGLRYHSGLGLVGPHHERLVARLKPLVGD